MAEQVRQELSQILQHEMNDPRIGWVTITRVQMSSDLCYAKVFISVLGDDAKDVRRSIAVLERASSFLRAELGRRVRLRMIPELQFKEDHSIEHSQRIMDLLKATKIPPDEDDSRSEDASSEGRIHRELTGEDRAEAEEGP